MDRGRFGPTGPLAGPWSPNCVHCQTDSNAYPRGPRMPDMDRQKILAIILVVLMIGSSFAYAVSSLF